MSNSEERLPIHVKWLHQEIESWVADDVVDGETAARIRARYALESSESSTSRSVLVFGVLGALLVVAGLSLIVSHNWDEFSRGTRALIAFALLLAAQAGCVYSLLRAEKDSALRESAAVFLVGALGTTMALISQTYHLGGELADLILAWLLLAIPIPHVMGSRIAAILLWPLLLYLPSGRDQSIDHGYSFIALAVALVPMTFLALRSSQGENRTRVLSFATFASLTLGLFILATERVDSLAWISAGASFVLCRLLARKESVTSYLATFAIGIVALFGTVSDTFEALSRGLSNTRFEEGAWLFAVLLSLAFVAYRVVRAPRDEMKDMGAALAFLPLLLLGVPLAMAEAYGFAILLFNLYVLGFGLERLLRGLSKLDRANTNVGLALLTALFFVRFVDSDFSFLVRGVSMIAIGLAFLGANLWIVRQSKEVRR